MFYQPGPNGLDLDVRKRDMPSVVTRLSASVSNCGEGVGGGGGGQVTLPGTRRPTSPLHHHAMPCTAALAFQGHANED